MRIDVPAGVALGNVTVTRNGADVTSAFRSADSGHGLVGLVTILPDVAGCELLNRYFDTIANPADWPGSRRTAVSVVAASAAVSSR